MSQFFIILNQIGVFVILLALGAICRRIKILNEVSLYSISQITVKVALPAFIFANTAFNSTKEDLIAALPVLPVFACLYIVLLLISMLLEKIFRLKGNRRNVFRMCLMFGNGGLFGLPLVLELYGNSSLIYCGLMTLIDMIIIWTYGVTLSYDTEGENAVSHRLTVKQFLRMMFSPALISVLLSIVFILFGWDLPGFVDTALIKTGNLLSPLGLIYMGGMLSWPSIRQTLGRKEIFAEVAVKMFALPILCYAVIRLAGFPLTMAGTVSIFAGLPTFMVSMMLAKNNGSDGDYAVGMVMITTLSCLITFPLSSAVISLLPL